MYQFKISIITVCYNAADLLEKTIQNVIVQTYTNIEYLIIDGASKDHTLSVIEKYKNHIAYFVSEEDNGIYDAMNKGIKKATGDYLFFLNAGDVLYSNQSLENFISNTHGEDFLYGMAVYVDNNQKITRPWHKQIPNAQNLSARSFINGMVVCHNCMLVKRELVPLYRTDRWKIASDIDWSIRVQKNVQTRFFYDKEPFYLFLEGGISKQRRKKALQERFQIFVEHFGFFTTIKAHIKILFQWIKRVR